MLPKSFSALAVLALAAQVAAEPMPYKPQLMKMSVREVFGVVRRQADSPGYQPTQAVCGVGATCEAACGAGYTTCASSDSQVHCYNPTASETCCPDASGNSCDAGYYCTAAKSGETFCCPNAMDLTACAAAYTVSEGLVSQTPKATSASSTSAPATTSQAGDKDSTATGTKTNPKTNPLTTTAGILPSGSFPGGSNKTTITSLSTMPAIPTQSKVPEGAGSMATPAGALVLFMAGVAAFL